VKPSSASGERTPRSAAAAPTRAPVAGVVGDRPVDDHGVLARSDPLELLVELALAVVAARRRVRAEVRVGELPCRHRLDARAERSRLFERQDQLALRVRIRAADHAERAFAERLVRDSEQQARIDAARVCDDDRAEAREQRAQALELLAQGVRVFRGGGKAVSWTRRAGSTGRRA
jgi:hypothetical protein